MNNFQRLFKKKPYLAWYVRDKQRLSEESMFEHVLSYGNWEDYLTAEDSLGIKKAHGLFQKLKSKRRVNLKPQTINYFNLYFQKYA